MDKIPCLEFDRLSFGVYTSAAIRKHSVLEVINPEPFDALEHPNPGGLYDRVMGTTEREEKCETCGLYSYFCPGHFGHIEFPLPVFSPVLIRPLFQLLQGMCFGCNKLLAPAVAKKLALYQIKALDYGLLGTVQDLAEAIYDTSISTSKNTSEIASSVEEKLQAILHKAIDGLDLKECSASSQVKAVAACRQQIIKDFVKSHLTSLKNKCSHCGEKHVKLLLRSDSRIVFTSGKKITISQRHSKRLEDMNREQTKEKDDHSNTVITPLEAKKRLTLLWENEAELLKQLFAILGVLITEGSDICPVDIFFCEALLVPPPRFRPLSKVKGRKYLNAQSAALRDVLTDCLLLRNIIKSMKGMILNKADQDAVDGIRGSTVTEKVNLMWHRLQNHVNGVYDSNMDKLKTGKVQSGLKQVLEKKGGLFRKHMMGKRVNYAARSVISPDPCIGVDEIGIPESFAKKLTYPAPVTDWNVEKIRAAVFNGPNVYPGAEKIEFEDGRVVKLSATDYLQRHAIACRLLTPPPYIQGAKRGIPKVVHRHMQDGDILMLNRQPTLHKPSIMGHKARILPGEKTLRLHYANCKSYNADFDGDEMNAHFPQGEVARAEGYHIASVNHQYLVPKDGTPLSGIIQDHVIAATVLTMRGSFFSREEYLQLVFGAMPFQRKTIKTLPPCIMKPKELWSGKQIVSTVILNLLPEGKAPPNVEGKSKVSIKNWQKVRPRKWKAGGTPLMNDSMSESEVIFHAGELLCGVLDKASIGPTPYGFVHCCYEIYGGETSSALLSAFGRLFTNFLHELTGFTLGIYDILLTDKAEKKRRKVMRRAQSVGDTVLAQAFDVDDPEDKEELTRKYRDMHLSRDDTGLKTLDFEMKKMTDGLNNDINRLCMPAGLKKKFPSNNLQLMVQSGAKGAMVNAMQISCLLGQVELEGRRVPLSLKGNTLPSFLPYDSSPRAGGFVDGRFLTGILPQEYFFHSMAGREGLIDTAVKTSRSGYLQRCLVKHLEGVSVHYDLTVRDSDGSLIQFLYGEDGLDISKTQLFKEDKIDLLAKNHEAVMSDAVCDIIEYNPTLLHHKSKISKWMHKHATQERKGRSSAFLKFSEKQMQKFQEDVKISAFVENWFQLDEESKMKLTRHTKKCPDPTTSVFRPDTTFASVSEKLDNIIEGYIEKYHHGVLDNNSFGHKSKYKDKSMKKHMSADDFRNMCYYRSYRGLADPGEGVGMLAAQSIGEPSTQMTLNTFHFAGRGEMNVTLGIPRLREILMFASANIATPTMDLPLCDAPDVEERAEQLKVKLSMVLMKQIIECVEIKEVLHVLTKTQRFRKYIIRMNFLPYKAYKGLLHVTPLGILDYVERSFIGRIITVTKKKLAIITSEKLINSSKIKKKSLANAKDEENNENDENAPPVIDIEVDGGGSSSDEGEGGDGDTLTSRSKSRHDQELEYDEPEEEEKIDDPEEEEIIEEEAVANEELPEEEVSEDEETRSSRISKGNKMTEEEKNKRIQEVLNRYNYVSHYDCDSRKLRWCEFTLQYRIEYSKLDMETIMEEEVEKAIVYRVPRVKKAFVVNNPNSKCGEKMIKTDGVNFLEIFGIDYVDVIQTKKVYSNDIHAIANIFGIEAARRAIIKEIKNVFATYGIEVDPRHLLLVADYMTYDGTIKPFNRTSIAHCPSSLQQMTFETTMTFLQSAILNASEEQFKSPSSRLCVGKPIGIGTGCTDIFVKPPQLIKQEKRI